MTLLYLDLLGTRSRWHYEGRPGVEAAFASFRDGVLAALETRPQGGLLHGAIESDSAALVFEDEVGATRAAHAIFQAAFDGWPSQREERQWIRGAIVAASGNGPLRVSRECPGPHGRITEHSYAGALLDAIAAERSGFKGMRLLIDDEVVTAPLRREWRQLVGAREFYPLKKLDHSGYPERVRGSYQDFLWMAACDEERWARNQRRMADRLRFAADDVEEFVQAAATQVAFHECAAIRGSLLLRED